MITLYNSTWTNKPLVKLSSAQWRFLEERDLTCPVTLKPVHNASMAIFALKKVN